MLKQLGIKPLSLFFIDRVDNYLAEEGFIRKYFEQSFENIKNKQIKKIDDKNIDDFCFIIKDNSEVIFFISNKEVKDMLAVWTDSKAFVTTLRSLFSLMWKKSRHVNETDAESILGSKITYEHRLREIEQEKMILNYLQENFQLLENNEGIRK